MTAVAVRTQPAPPVAGPPRDRCVLALLGLLLAGLLGAALVAAGLDGLAAPFLAAPAVGALVGLPLGCLGADRERRARDHRARLLAAVPATAATWADHVGRDVLLSGWAEPAGAGARDRSSPLGGAVCWWRVEVRRSRSGLLGAVTEHSAHGGALALRDATGVTVLSAVGAALWAPQRAAWWVPGAASPVRPAVAVPADLRRAAPIAPAVSSASRRSACRGDATTGGAAAGAGGYGARGVAREVWEWSIPQGRPLRVLARVGTDGALERPLIDAIGRRLEPSASAPPTGRAAARLAAAGGCLVLAVAIALTAVLG